MTFEKWFQQNGKNGNSDYRSLAGGNDEKQKEQFQNTYITLVKKKVRQWQEVGKATDCYHVCGRQAGESKMLA